MNQNEEALSNADDDLISYQVASKRARVFAFLLDFLLVVAFVFMLLSTFVLPRKYPVQMKELQGIIETYKTSSPEEQKNMAEEFSPELRDMFESVQAFIVLAFWLYFSVFEIFMNGSTLGKKVFSLKAISLKTGHKPPFFDSCLRGGIKTLSLLAFFPILMINYFLIFFTKANRAGHDLLCNTIVVVTTPEEDALEAEEDE